MPADATRLLVLLLPAPLERFVHRSAAESLLPLTGVVAVDPPRVPYETLARIPDALGVPLSSRQARRLRRRLPGEPCAVAIFDAAQYPLARALLSQSPGCELWYGTDPGHFREFPSTRAERRREELRVLAAGRAALTFAPAGDDEPLLERMAELEVGR